MKSAFSVVVLLAVLPAAYAQDTADQATVDAAFLDFTQILIRTDRIENVDAETQAWGRGLIAGLGIEGLPAQQKAKKILDFVHGNLVFNWTRPKSVAEFIETKAGNCFAHARMGIFLLRLSGVPAKFAYEVHLQLGSESATKDAREMGTGLFSCFHNDHAWVLFYDGERWIPYDSTAGHLGGEGFIAQRWTPPEANPPFVIWEDMGTGLDNMENVTQDVWEGLRLPTHGEMSEDLWREFMSSFADKPLDYFSTPLSDDEMARIERAARAYYAAESIP